MEQQSEMYYFISVYEYWSSHIYRSERVSQRKSFTLLSREGSIYFNGLEIRGSLNGDQKE
jgi:hypothetical protein